MARALALAAAMLAVAACRNNDPYADFKPAHLLEELAASLGYEPLGLTDPIRALEVLRRAPTRIDALVTDERMPGMRGTELARSVRELRPDLPILLVTGYRSADLDREAARSGIARILDKPVHRNELAQALGDLVR